MLAAIYARKSTEQNVADEAKSVTRQIEHAKAYAERKGWTVDDEHIYVDDGISGAEFANRPGFVRLMEALKPSPKFGALIMSEESRLGREQIEVSFALKQLVQAGVRVFLYLTDTERTLNSPIEKAMLALQTMADEMERARAAQRVTDSFLRKAQQGHVCGGKTFGYDNVAVIVAGERSHVTLQPNEQQAAIVRSIFERFAGGQGLKQIAHGLNAEHAPCPRGQQGRPDGWSPSTIRAILHRPLYRGEYVYNRTKKRDAWGKRKKIQRPESDLVRSERPDLRIVPDALWQAVQARIKHEGDRYLRTSDGRVLGRPARHVKYLLTGLAQCPCGSGLEAFTPPRAFAQPGRPRVYGCAAHRRKGPRACACNAVFWVDEGNDAVLGKVEQLLTPDIVDQIVEDTLARYTASGAAQRQVELERERVKVEDELARLVHAVASGGAELQALTAAIRQRETRRQEIEGELASLRVRTTAIDRLAIDKALRARMKEWRGLLRKRQEQGRQILQKLVLGRLVFTPQADGMIAFKGNGTLKGLLFDGQIAALRKVASLTGFEPVLPP